MTFDRIERALATPALIFLTADAIATPLAMLRAI